MKGVPTSGNPRFSGFHQIWILLLVAGMGCALLFPGLGSTPIFNGDEARFAQAAREMRHADEWVVPSFAGKPRYDKPIGIYWLCRLSYAAFGENTLAARLPSVLAALLSVLFLFLEARRRWGPKSGVAAAAMLLINPLFSLLSRACTADALNSLWILLAMISLMKMYTREDGIRDVFLFWFSLAMGLLSKGPVILLFIGGTVLGIQILQRRWQRFEAILAGGLFLWAAFGGGPVVIFPILLWLSGEFVLGLFHNNPDARPFVPGYHWVWGPILVLILVLPWGLSAAKATGGEFFRVALGHHVIERSLSTLEHHQGFPGIYILGFFILAFPWAPMLPHALRETLQKARTHREPAFLLAWILGPLLLLESLRTKLLHYEMPIFPAAILLIILVLQSSPRRLCLSRRPLVMMTVFSGALILALLPLVPVFYFDLPQLFSAGLILCGILIIPSLYSLFVNEARRALMIRMIAMACFLPGLFSVYLPRFSESFIGPRSADEALMLLPPDGEIILYKLRDEEILFYLPPSTRVAFSPEELHRLLKTRPRGLLISRKKDWERLGDDQIRLSLSPDAEVSGLDLGRGKSGTTLFFRLRPAPQGVGL